MAVDIIARGLATSLIGSDGKVASEKMPTLSGTTELEGFTSIGKLTDASLIEGRTAEEILLMMLYGVVNPTFTEPKLSIALSDENKMPIIGRQSLLKGTLTFDRGQINPAYNTSGYRTGAPTQYLIGDIITNSSSNQFDFEIEVIPTKKEMTIPYAVSYGAGEQPTNSLGQPFGAPYPAGSISQLLDLIAVYELYQKDGSKQEFTWFEEEDGFGYSIILAFETATEKQSFMISSEMNIIGIKSFNPLSQQWEWLGGETAAVSLTHFDTTVIKGQSLGEETDYILYTHNQPRVGERELRVYVQ